MAVYIATVQAQTNAAANTYDSFILLIAKSGATIRVRRFSIAVRGVPPSTEVALEVQLNQKLNGGPGSTAGSGIALNPLFPITTTGVSLKSGSSSFGQGAVQNTLRDFAINQRATYEWVGSYPDELPIPVAGDCIGLDIRSSGVGTSLTVEMLWEE